MPVAIINNNKLPITDYRNSDMKDHGNNEFRVGDIVRCRSNGIIQYCYVTSIVNSGLNVTDLNLESNDSITKLSLSNIINPRHKGMINFSRAIYRCNTEQFQFL
jgi:hypothetical protein